MPTHTLNQDSSLRAEIERLAPWHHDIEVAPGVTTGGGRTLTGDAGPTTGSVSLIRPDRILGWTLGDIYPGGLEGRSILDCACNAGGYLFAAAGMGAGRRVGFDARDHWIDQARFVSERREDREVELHNCDLYRLPTLELGRFDITLFMGILYHLPDPVTGLQIAADHTNELLVVNTHVIPHRTDALILKPEGVTQLMSGVHGLAWSPTGPRVVRQMLAWCGFPHSRIQFDIPIPQGRRIQIVAAREAATFAAWDEKHPEAPSRRRDRIGRMVRRVFHRA